jgi:hypothetical protein
MSTVRSCDTRKCRQVEDKPMLLAANQPKGKRTGVAKPLAF